MTAFDIVMLAVSLLFGTACTAWLTNRFDLRKPNFRGVRIPYVAGLVFVLTASFDFAISWIFDGAHAGSKLAYIVAVLGFGVLGFWDDIAGDRSVGGFRGHINALRSGKVTTGAIKMFGGGLISGVCALMLWYPYVGHCLVAWLLIPLCANTLNLLDLRPGRCLFGFLVMSAVSLIALAVQGQIPVAYFLTIAIAVAVCLYALDASGKIMIGDTGSNAFGAFAGVAFALYVPIGWQIAIVAALVGLNLWCESHSLSRLIEGNAVLRSIDRKIGVR